MLIQKNWHLIGSIPVPTVWSRQPVSYTHLDVYKRQGYHKVKVYGEFKNISLFDDISLIGKPYNFHQIQNDYAFNYQYYLYSLNIFDTLQLEKIKSNQHQDHLYHYLEKRIKTSLSLIHIYQDLLIM